MDPHQSLGRGDGVARRALLSWTRTLGHEGRSGVQSPQLDLVGCRVVPGQSLVLSTEQKGDGRTTNQSSTTQERGFGELGVAARADDKDNGKGLNATEGEAGNGRSSVDDDG